MHMRCSTSKSTDIVPPVTPTAAKQPNRHLHDVALLAVNTARGLSDFVTVQSLDTYNFSCDDGFLGETCVRAIRLHRTVCHEGNDVTLHQRYSFKLTSLRASCKPK